MIRPKQVLLEAIRNYSTRQGTRDYRVIGQAGDKVDWFSYNKAGYYPLPPLEIELKLRI
jgi:hypothetical protein